MWTRQSRGRMAEIARRTRRYPTDPTDEEWRRIEPRLAEVSGRGRKPTTDPREVWPLSCLGVFGSWARHEQRDTSDLDLLVDFDQPIGFELIALEDEIERRLGLPVDLVLRDSLRRRIGRQILDEMQPVWRPAG